MQKEEELGKVEDMGGVNGMYVASLDTRTAFDEAKPKHVVNLG